MSLCFVGFVGFNCGLPIGPRSQDV